MSLNIALSSAVNSLLVIEQQMSVTSNNISNANTAGYTQETVQTQSVVTNGVVSGVVGEAASTYINTYLEQSIISNASSSAQASTYYSYYQTLAQAMGTISTSDSGGTDLASELSSLQTTLTSLSNSPEDTALKTKAISELSTLCDDLRTTSASIQEQRAQADQGVSSAVNDANSQLQTIATLNSQIVQAQATGESTAALQDSRYQALQNLSSDLGVSYYISSNGAMQVYTTDGTPLLTGATPNTISHAAASTMDSSISYTAGASTGISGITVNGKDITSDITTGKIAALVKMRDTDLVNAQSELDNLASSVASTLNATSNLGTSVTAPQTLTGESSSAFSSSSAVTVAAGTTVRIALLDSSGNATSHIDVSLAGDTTVGAIVNSINTAISGASMGMTCSLSSSGQLVLSSSSSSYGVGITTLSGSISGTASSTATDFSNYFQMNDLLVSTDASKTISAETITVRSDILSTPAYLASGVLSSAATIGSPAVTSGDGSIAGDLASDLTSNQSLSASGYLSAITTSFSSYAASIVSDISQRNTNASSTATTATSALTTLQTTFSSQSGVNTDEQTAALTELQNLYQASAKVVSTVQTMFQALLTAVNG
ncbi:flagellar hook-associated protein 1 [mine drainage metagenome]|uniref:Flagellar hook-associated protein 1 n=1 Tax=mine drainage metagenome TaxID=410659 RepID=A0A1J5RPH8_9ZZZZ